MVTTKKKIAKEYTQKEMRKEFKCFTMKNNQSQKKAVMQDMQNKKVIRQIENKQQNDIDKFLLIRNYFKCEWIKLSNQDRH